MASKAGPVTQPKPTRTTVSARMVRTLHVNGKGYYYKTPLETTDDGREIRPLMGYIGLFNGQILGDPNEVIVTVAAVPASE